MTGATPAAARPGVSLPRSVGRLLVVLVALVAGWVALRHALHGLLERERPDLALAISPASPVSQAVVALDRAALVGGRADAEEFTLIRTALRRSPLLAEPLIVAGLDAGSRDQDERARRLFLAAERRDPRAIIPHYWLFDYALRSGRYAEGLAEAQPLIRLQPATEAGTVAELTALVDLPAARPALVAALRGRPDWRGRFFRQLAASARLADRGAALLTEVSQADLGTSLADRRALIQGLVRRGQFARAHAEWEATLPAEYRRRAGSIYDGDFQGWPGSPPFNWRLASAERGIVRAGVLGDPPYRTSLSIEALGDVRQTLAEQIVPISAGAYLLSFVTRSLAEDGEGGAGLEVQVQCAAARQVLASAVVRKPPWKATAYSVAFQVPRGCSAIQLRASAVPGVEPGPLKALLTGLTLAKR